MRHVLISSFLLVSATAANSQKMEPARVELMPGVTFTGIGGVGEERLTDGSQVATFWRPVGFESKDGPIGGRLDCRAVARRDPFTLALFELEGAHLSEASRFERNRWSEIERTKEDGPNVHVLDVVMRRSEPARYGVMTYIAVRTGDDVVSIRRLCSFIRGEGAWRPDYKSLVRRYTGFDITLPPPSSADPLATPTLENMIDTEN